MVEGQFSPSDTRKWLTALAKKGGMKAVLTAVGSVIPGFGNVSGFLAGTAIDVLYGKDINKLIDKVADTFDDNKVYVFECPNCGHTWTRKEDLILGHPISVYASDSYSDIRHESLDDTSSDEAQAIFNKDFDYFLDKVDKAIKDIKTTEALSDEMCDKGEEHMYDEIIASQYFFLAGLCLLLYSYENIASKDLPQVLYRAKSNLEQANRLFSTEEIILMLYSVQTLQCDTPELCTKEGTIETEYYDFKIEPLFKSEWLIALYEACRFLSIQRAHEIMDDAEDGKYTDDSYTELWKTGLNLQNKDYRMICNLNVAIYCTDREEGENVSLEEAQALDNVVNTPGYRIEECDVNDFFDKGWLEGCVYFAQSVIENENPYAVRDVAAQINILERISNLENCFPVFLACEALGKYYEEGVVVEKNISKALGYYKKAGSEEDIVRLKNKSKIWSSSVSSGTNSSISHTSGTSFSINDSSSISDNESEYVEEVKACLENGEISKGERRLLEKIRIKLGISEERAIELENQLKQPELSAEEQEYLEEYQECLADGGSISASERRLLNRLRTKLNISEERAQELENI